jgi:hypothetical protein
LDTEAFLKNSFYSKESSINFGWMVGNQKKKEETLSFFFPPSFFFHFSGLRSRAWQQAAGRALSSLSLSLFSLSLAG